MKKHMMTLLIALSAVMTIGFSLRAEEPQDPVGKTCDLSITHSSKKVSCQLVMVGADGNATVVAELGEGESTSEALKKGFEAISTVGVPPEVVETYIEAIRRSEATETALEEYGVESIVELEPEEAKAFLNSKDLYAVGPAIVLEGESRENKTLADEVRELRKMVEEQQKMIEQMKQLLEQNLKPFSPNALKWNEDLYKAIKKAEEDAQDSDPQLPSWLLLQDGC